MGGFAFSRLTDLSLAEKDAAEAASGFGCIRCGVTIAQYFAARWEADERRFLLCPACAPKVTSGAITPEQLARLCDDPIALLPHFDRDHLPFSPMLPALSIAGRERLEGISAPIMLGWMAPIRFFPPVRGNGATLLSISLGAGVGDGEGKGEAGGEGGAEQLVERNEWVADPARWSFAARGGRYHFTATAGDARLVLHWEARDHVIVEELVARLDGRLVEVTRGEARIDGAPVRADFHEHRMVGLQIEP